MLNKIREIIGFPFMLFGFIFISIGLILAFGYKVYTEFYNKFNETFN